MIDVALITEFAASRKEPLAAVLERIHAAFAISGAGQPHIQFTFADAPVAGFTSSVDRVLKRHSDLERFVSSASPMPGAPAVRMISNGIASPSAGDAVDFWTLLKIAAGVPKSFPFHSVAFHFQSAAFGTAAVSHPLFSMPPGIVVTDSWWVSGRMRAVRAVTCVEAEPSGRKLAAPPDTLRAIGEIVVDYKSRLAEIVERARLPHALDDEETRPTHAFGAGEATGPKKPVLVRAFQPMGYDCRSESGTYTLRRRTPANLTVEIFLDVGTWSRSLTAFFAVNGFGFGARLGLPVSKHAIGRLQYPIGDGAHWQKIVDNLAALVAELDRTLVPAIEAVSGPAPEWYRPG